MNLDHLEQISEDVARIRGLLESAEHRMAHEIKAIRDAAAGQQDLPAPVGEPAPAGGPVVHRLIEAVDAIEEAVESSRAQVALDACRDLRMLIDGLR